MGINDYFGMIVFTKSKKRFKNYEYIKNYITNLNLHLAFDTTTIEKFEKAFEFGKNKNFFNENIKENLLHFKRYGAIGNFISHILTYQNILNKNYENYLIFEDDIGFSENPEIDLKKIEILLKNLPEKYDYISLDYRNSSKECIQKRQYKNFKVEEQYNQFYKQSKYFYRMIPQWGASAKIISKEGIKKILANLPSSVSNDNYINELIVKEKLNAFIPREDFIPFKTLGVLFNKREENSKFGSLIWGIKD